MIFTKFFHEGYQFLDEITKIVLLNTNPLAIAKQIFFADFFIKLSEL